MKDLAKRVAELFSEKPWKHDPVHDLGYKYTCQRCDITKSQHEYNWFRETECTVPPRIRLNDLGKALECFRGLPPYYASPAIKGVSPNGEIDFEWVVIDATAEQIWEICILAKESEK